MRRVVLAPVTGGAVVSEHKAQFARELRARSTSAEKTAWEALRARRLRGLKFRRQQPIAGFIVDFVCVELGLIVEIDGEIHDDQREADAERTQLLESRGFRVVRIQNEDVSAAHLEQVIARFASDSPSPFMERGLGGEVLRSTRNTSAPMRPQPVAQMAGDLVSSPSPFMERGLGGEVLRSTIEDIAKDST